MMKRLKDLRLHVVQCFSIIFPTKEEKFVIKSVEIVEKKKIGLAYLHTSCPAIEETVNLVDASMHRFH